MSSPEKRIVDECFSGVKLLEPDFYEDFRGDYWTIYKQSEAGTTFNHDKATKSRKMSLRGIHGDFQTTKLISCLSGEIYCVIVDNRKESKDYNKWCWLMLTCDNKKSVILPPGVGLSYLVMSESATVLYKLSYPDSYQDINDQFTIPWNDKNLGIFWPTDKPILQQRDV